MTHGSIGRSRRRYPVNRRREAKYGNIRFARRAGKLPPHLLPSADEERSSSKSSAKMTRRVLLIGALLVFAFATTGLLGFFIVSAIVGAFATVRAYEDVNAELPDAAQVTIGTFQTTSIFDRNGTLLQEVDNPYYGWRTYVGLDQISDHLINATVAAEDSTFWTNQGVDPVAIVRGGFIIFSGAGSSGGSTITQQLVRSLYPEQIGFDYSLWRKGREALAAIALAKRYSKRDILTMYLNLIYYGARAYGIEAAAETYFNKHAKDLNLAEASMLAGLPQAPSYYEPSNPDSFPQAKIRQQYVLDQMVQYRYITREEADAAWNEPLNPQNTRSGAVQNAPHFTEWVRQYVINRFGEDALYSGLNLHTSIDLNLQLEAEEMVASGVADLLQQGMERNNGAMVVMVPHSGEVLAMVGSADFEDASINGQVNFATSLIQPGSSVKPIVYAAAFENGWNPATVVMDIPSSWEVPNQDDYEPMNYSRRFYGAVTVREALANSFNIPAVKAVDYVGVEGVMDMSRRMGVKESLEEDAGFYGLSFGLGSAEVQLLEHTNAYATLANYGKYVPAHPVTKITDGQGNVLYELNEETLEQESEQAMAPGVAFQVTSILTDNESRARVFTTNNRFGNTQQELGRDVAAKSGTTENWRDLWTMGYTTDVAIGVWVGRSGDGGSESLHEIDGIQAAGPIWQRMMYLIHGEPEFEQLLWKDGSRLPEDFEPTDDVERASLCAATGHRAGWGEDVSEWVVDGNEPTLACGELSDFEMEELEKAVDAVESGRVNWASGAVESINQYTRAYNRIGPQSGNGGSIESSDDEDEPNVDPPDSDEENQTDDDNQTDEEPTAEQIIEPED